MEQRGSKLHICWFINPNTAPCFHFEMDGAEGLREPGACRGAKSLEMPSRSESQSVCPRPTGLQSELEPFHCVQLFLDHLEYIYLGTQGIGNAVLKPKNEQESASVYLLRLYDNIHRGLKRRRLRFNPFIVALLFMQRIFHGGFGFSDTPLNYIVLSCLMGAWKLLDENCPDTHFW
mmetsp:Transcript_14269/g.38963  ORF Transcript_14269/g.38963 Transcript_14269/m.38963 type:complete len:176 (+) Transcript_14269:314-841(+)